MTDAFGTRAVFSVLLPATNAVVEPDMAALRPVGVTNQSCRFPFSGLPDTLEGLMALMRPTLELALACEPDRIVVAYTLEYLPDGVTVAPRLRDFVHNTVRLPTTMASDAVPEALKTLGAQRIGLVTPYLPETNRNVEAYFAALGFSVASAVGLSSAQKGRVYTARINEAEVRNAFARADTPDVEALVQVGTALVCAGFAADLEARHGKPVIAVNAATYWLALRRHGIADSVDGHGVLLKSH